MTNIVGVHGIGNHLPELAPVDAAARLTRIWSSALALCTGVDDGFDLTVAYYAHHLRKSAQQSGETDPDTLDDEGREMLTQWAGELVGEEAHHGGMTVPPRQIIGGMAGNRFSGALLMPFATVFTHEMQKYLGKRYRDRRIKAREEVATAIRSRRASVVLAHSLGSVVAYEALWANPDIEVDLLVTLGSPLAMRGMVFDRLDPATNGVRPARRPPGVRRWVNIADPGDIVAVPKWLRRAFDLDLDLETVIHTFDFHKVHNYLSCATLGAVLRGYR